MDEDAFLAVGGAGLFETSDDAVLVTLPRQNMPPMACATSSPFSAFMSKIATLAPAAARASALARPRPEAPPVTTAAVSLVICIGLCPLFVDSDGMGLCQIMRRRRS